LCTASRVVQRVKPNHRFFSYLPHDVHVPRVFQKWCRTEGRRGGGEGAKKRVVEVV